MHALNASGTVLHVGCGQGKLDQAPFAKTKWEEIRLDVNPNVQPDVIGSIINMEAVKTGSVDAVLHPIISNTFIQVKCRLR